MIQEINSDSRLYLFDLVIASESLIELPDNLRHKFGFELKNEFGTSALTFEWSLPELAGKRLAVNFSPATLEYVPFASFGQLGI